MKILETAMSYRPKDAEGLITSITDVIVTQLAKILCLKSNESEIKEWTDEIADKYVSRIRKIINKTSDKKKHLREDRILEVFKGGFEESEIPARIREVLRDRDYKDMDRTGSQEDLTRIFLSIRPNFATTFKSVVNMLLKNDYRLDDEIAKMWVDIILSVKPK